MSTPPPSNIKFVPINTPERNTVRFEKLVLLIIRADYIFSRLEEVCSAIFADTRIQCVFTIPEPKSIVDRSLDLYLKDAGCILLPWNIALTKKFDLAIAASPNGDFEKIDAPLLLFQHGPALGKSGAYDSTLKAINRLKTREYPTYICEPTSKGEITDLPANIKTVYVGDPVFDKILYSEKYREEYRAALNCNTQKLVIITSTWGPNSLLSNIRTIAEDLLRELPYTEYRVAMILHPYIWAAHGEWQIKTWFKKELYAGLNIVPHEIGWEAAIIAADIVIGDYGSVTNYGASIGKPVLRYEPSEDSVPKGIAIAEHANINSIPIKNSYKALTVIRALEATPLQTNRLEPTAFANVGHSLESIQHLVYSILGIKVGNKAPEKTLAQRPRPIQIDNEIYRTITLVKQQKGEAILNIKAFKSSSLDYNWVFDGPRIQLIEKEAMPSINLAPPEIVVIDNTLSSKFVSRLMDTQSDTTKLVCINKNSEWIAILNRVNLFKVQTDCPDSILTARAIWYLLKLNKTRCILETISNNYIVSLMKG